MLVTFPVVSYFFVVLSQLFQTSFIESFTWQSPDLAMEVDVKEWKAARACAGSGAEGGKPQRIPV